MCTYPCPRCFRYPIELFLRFCGPKCTCHFYFNPLNIFLFFISFFSLSHSSKIIQRRFLNDGKHFTVEIDSFVSECTTIHSLAPPSARRELFSTFNSKTFVFVRRYQLFFFTNKKKTGLRSKLCKSLADKSKYSDGFGYKLISYFLS